MATACICCDANAVSETDGTNARISSLVYSGKSNSSDRPIIVTAQKPQTPDFAKVPSLMKKHISSVGFGPAEEPIARRAAIFIGILAIHICIIILLILSKYAVPQKKKQGTLSVFSVAASSSPPAIVIPKPIIPIEANTIVSSPAEVLAEQQSAEGNPDGEVCSPLAEVTAQLAADPIVPLAIDRVLPSDRSISEAIVMWNAEWSDVAAAEQSPMAEVRDRVLLILEGLPPECLATPVSGPRLIAIPENGYTTFLAFGSGEWSWQQLVEPPGEVLTTEENSWNWEDLFRESGPST